MDTDERLDTDKHTVFLASGHKRYFEMNAVLNGFIFTLIS